MTVDGMRAVLRLGPEVPDAEVMAAYDEYLASQPAGPTTATATDLRARNPEFTGVADATIAYWLSDALRTVTPAWGDDALPAQIDLASHNMARRNVPGITKTEAENLPAGVTRFRSASMDIGVSEAAANRSMATGYGSTRYGEEFRVFLRRNVGGPRLAGCA